MTLMQIPLTEPAICCSLFVIFPPVYQMFTWL